MTDRPKRQRPKQAAAPRVNWSEFPPEQLVRKLTTAAAAKKCVESGDGEAVAYALLRAACGQSREQNQYWRVIAKLYANEAWRGLFKPVEGKASLPGQADFSAAVVGAVAEPIIKLCGRDGLVWGGVACLRRTGKAATKIEALLCSEATSAMEILKTLDASVQAIADQALAPATGAAGRIARMIDQKVQEEKITAPILSETFRSLPFNPKDLRILLSAISAPATDQPKTLSETDALVAEAAWLSADKAIAGALQQTPRVRQFMKEAGRIDAEAQRFIGELVSAVLDVAARRSLEIVEAVDAVVDFEPTRHVRYDSKIVDGSKVRIIRPTVRQSVGGEKVIARQGEVEFVPS